MTVRQNLGERSAEQRPGRSEGARSEEVKEVGSKECSTQGKGKGPPRVAHTRAFEKGQMRRKGVVGAR